MIFLNMSFQSESFWHPSTEKHGNTVRNSWGYEKYSVRCWFSNPPSQLAKLYIRECRCCAMVDMSCRRSAAWRESSSYHGGQCLPQLQPFYYHTENWLPRYSSHLVHLDIFLRNSILYQKYNHNPKTEPLIWII